MFVWHVWWGCHCQEDGTKTWHFFRQIPSAGSWEQLSLQTAKLLDCFLRRELWSFSSRHRCRKNTGSPITWFFDWVLPYKTLWVKGVICQREKSAHSASKNGRENSLQRPASSTTRTSYANVHPTEPRKPAADSGSRKFDKYKASQLVKDVFQGVTYEFRALCFGPTSAPRVFTKVISVVVAHLRKFNIRLVSYLDDWLAANETKRLLLQDRAQILSLLYRQCFVVNKEKSQLIQVQSLIYLGSQWDLIKGLVYPTNERWTNLKLAVTNIQKGHCTAKHFMILLDMIASCLELIPNARLFMRPIQLHLLQHWSPARMKLSVQVPLNPQLIQDLNWFSLSQNIGLGRSVVKESYPVTLTTNTSGKHGWGGHMNNLTCQGQWTKNQKLMHINCLEMMAVQFSLEHFLSHLKIKNVLIRSDNTTVCQYINRQGGTKYPQLCSLTMKLWLIALKNNITLKAVHIMGKKNVLADTLSQEHPWKRRHLSHWRMHLCGISHGRSASYWL